jgi:tripartite-type tricarboxylate transporter receptor subunit TctC
MAMLIRWSAGACAILLATGAMTNAAAQSRTYPVKPIRMIVGFAAGANTDTVARLVARGISERLEQPVVVDNRAGAGGSIATDMVAKAPGDGYTIMTVSSALASYPAIYRKLPFDVERDIAPIAYIGALPTVLSVRRALPVRNLQELIQHAKAKPGAIKYGTAGLGSTTHMMTELFASIAGIKMVHIPYKSAPLATVAMMGGEFELQLETLIGVLPHLNHESQRRLAITGASRSRLAPDIPTFAEAGLPAFTAEAFFAVVGPATMPRPIIDRLNATINAVLETPEVQTRLATNGGIVLAPMPVAQFATLLRTDIAKWKRISQEAGIDVQ